MEWSFLVSFIFLLVLLYWSAWISSTETAFFSLPSHTLKTYRDNQDSRKRLIAQMLMRPRDLLVTVFMINTFVNIMVQNVSSDMFKNAGWGLKVALPLVLTLVFGEIVPKYIGLQNNIKISYRTAPTIELLQRMLAWIRKWIIAITTPISRVMFFYLKKEDNISLEELEHVLKTSEERGVLKREESELLSGFLHLQNHQVKELMIPKVDIISYNTEEPISKLIYLFADAARTRLPVCSESLDHVLGIIDASDFFIHQHEIRSPSDLQAYLQTPLYIPENSLARLALKRMDEQRQVLALVVDEYGSLTGLISREDLIEVVVGKIEDFREQQTHYIVAGKNEVITSGKWDIEDFNTHFKSNLESETNMVTIGGWLIEQLGEIPKSGSKYELNGFLFHVLAASPNRINRLFIKKL